MKELQQLNLYQTFPRQLLISSLAYINMQKLPMYIGVFVEDNKAASKQIRQYVHQGLRQLLESQEEQDHLIYQDLNNFEQTFKPPNDNYHLTTLFLGGNTKKLTPKQTKQYNNFNSDQKALLKMDCIVYIPGYIICAYCPDTDGVEVDNKFPHVTLYLGSGAKAVESNMVIESLVQKNPELFGKNQIKTSLFNLSFNKFKTAYVINKKLQLKGATGTNFTHGKR